MKNNKMSEKNSQKINLKNLINKIYKISQKIIQNSKFKWITDIINII
jgi:hypothetical protein